MSHRRKLIEVSLPLEAINKASVYEKYISTGHPNALHKWWSRKPLSAARAILFASIVDDPSEYLEDEEKIQEQRELLFRLIDHLVRWENIGNEEVLKIARVVIARSIAYQKGVEITEDKEAILEFLQENAPPVLDPFAGGGSIPLEAQRLGLRAYASDINPVAVLINKAMLEIPNRFRDQPTVQPMLAGDPNSEINELIKKMGVLKFSSIGVTRDLRYYGDWIQEEAEKRLGWLYPEVELPPQYGGGSAIVVAWLWARTVKCPNPACGAEMPLTSKWVFSEKKDKSVWAEPIVDFSKSPPLVKFSISNDDGSPPERTVNRRGAHCIACNAPVNLSYIREQGRSKRLGVQMIAIVAIGNRGRIYLPPSEAQIAIEKQAQPDWIPEQEILEGMSTNITTYGYTKFGDFFTNRQLVALNTLSDLIQEVHKKIEIDAEKSGMLIDELHLDEGGKGALAYADAIVTYLAFAFSKTLNRSNAFVPWNVSTECPVNLFSRHTIPFIWDFAESNVIFGPTGSFSSMLKTTIGGLRRTILDIPATGTAFMCDASEVGREISNAVISTDPPYYDMINYADLSDFFYLWLRRLLSEIYPDLFSTLLTPKDKEITANADRAGGEEEAKEFFESGIFKAFRNLRNIANPDYPTTIYYAYKQKETRKDAQQVSTGWETILSGIINAGFSITGTWPIRTEREMKMSSIGANVLASSIVLVCRPRDINAKTITRREFLAKLRHELPHAIKQLQQGSIAPVDLAQAAIGPGISVYSRFSHILEANGSPMPVRSCLKLINQVLDECLTEQEGEYDSDTRWALAWFEQYGHETGPYGAAETLSKAKNISVGGLERAGILEARSGQVRILHRNELSENWSPQKDKRLTIWEATHYLLKTLDKEGEQAAAQLLSALGNLSESARNLTYRLFVICERNDWNREALDYNMLVVAWPRLRELRQRQARKTNLDNYNLY